MPSSRSSSSSRRSCSALVSGAIGNTRKGTPNWPATPSRSGWLLTHQRHLAGQLAGAVAEQQVVEAVVVARHEDRHALAVRRVGDAPAHREALGRLADRVLEGEAVGVELGEVEAHALEELPRHEVGVLVRIQDVRAVAVEELGHRRHDAAPVGAVDEQGGGFGGGGHGPASLGAAPGAGKSASSCAADLPIDSTGRGSHSSSSLLVAATGAASGRRPGALGYGAQTTPGARPGSRRTRPRREGGESWINP